MAALRPLLALLSLSQVAAFGSLPSGTVEVIGESAENEKGIKSLKLDENFCTKIDSKTDLGKEYCSTIKDAEVCGNGDKTFRRSSNIANAYDTCIWSVGIGKGQGAKNIKCRPSGWLVHCNPTCLTGGVTAEMTDETIALSTGDSGGSTGDSGGSTGDSGVCTKLVECGDFPAAEVPCEGTTTCKCTTIYDLAASATKKVCQFRTVATLKQLSLVGTRRSRRLSTSCASQSRGVLDTKVAGNLALITTHECKENANLDGTRTCQCSTNTIAEIVPTDFDPDDDETAASAACVNSVAVPWPFYKCANDDSSTCVEVTGDDAIGGFQQTSPGNPSPAGTYPNSVCWSMCPDGKNPFPSA